METTQNIRFETPNLGPNLSPWQRQKHWKEREGVPSMNEIMVLMNRYDELIEKALFAITYLTAGRISEIIKRPYLKKNYYKKGEDGKVMMNEHGSPMIERTEKIKLDYPGIRRKDLSIQHKQGKKLLLVNMQNRKNKTLKRKELPIPCDKGEQSAVKNVSDYANNLDFEQPLFDFQIGKAEKIIAKAGMNPHFLRDIRLTHLVKFYGFSAFHLQKYAGWKDPRPAEVYVRLSWDDLVERY